MTHGCIPKGEKEINNKLVEEKRKEKTNKKLT